MTSDHRWLVISSLVLVTGVILVQCENSASSSSEESSAELRKLEELIRTEILTYFKLLMSENDDELKSLLLVNDYDSKGEGEPYIVPSQGQSADQGRISSISFGHPGAGPAQGLVFTNGASFQSHPTPLNTGAQNLAVRSLPSDETFSPMQSGQWREGTSGVSQFNQVGPEGVAFRFGGRYPQNQDDMRYNQGPSGGLQLHGPPPPHGSPPHGSPPHGPPPHGPPPHGPPRYLSSSNGPEFDGNFNGELRPKKEWNEPPPHGSPSHGPPHYLSSSNGPEFDGNSNSEFRPKKERKEFRGSGGPDSDDMMERKRGGGSKSGKRQRESDFGSVIVELPLGKMQQGMSMRGRPQLGGKPGQKNSAPIANEYSAMQGKAPGDEYSPGKMQSQISMKPEVDGMMMMNNLNGALQQQMPPSHFPRNRPHERKGKVTDKSFGGGSQSLKSPVEFSMAGIRKDELPLNEGIKTGGMKGKPPNGGGVMMNKGSGSGFQPPKQHEFSMSGGPNRMGTNEGGGFQLPNIQSQFPKSGSEFGSMTMAGSVGGWPQTGGMMIEKQQGGEFQPGKMQSQISMKDYPDAEGMIMDQNSGGGFQLPQPHEFSMPIGPNMMGRNTGGGFQLPNMQYQFPASGKPEFGGTMSTPPVGQFPPVKMQSQFSVNGRPEFGGITSQTPGGEFSAGRTQPMKSPMNNFNGGFQWPHMEHGFSSLNGAPEFNGMPMDKNSGTLQPSVGGRLEHGKDDRMPPNHHSQTRGLENNELQMNCRELANMEEANENVIGDIAHPLENTQMGGGHGEQPSSLGDAARGHGKNRKFRLLILNGDELPENLKMNNVQTQTMMMSSTGDGLGSTRASAVGSHLSPDEAPDSLIAGSLPQIEPFPSQVSGSPLPLSGHGSSSPSHHAHLPHHATSSRPSQNSGPELPAELSSSVAGISTPSSPGSAVEVVDKVEEAKQARETNAPQKPKILRMIPVKLPASQKN